MEENLGENHVEHKDEERTGHQSSRSIRH